MGKQKHVHGEDKHLRGIYISQSTAAHILNASGGESSEVGQSELTES